MKQEKPLDASVYQLRLSETLLDSTRFFISDRTPAHSLEFKEEKLVRVDLLERVDACILFISFTRRQSCDTNRPH